MLIQFLLHISPLYVHPVFRPAVLLVVVRVFQILYKYYHGRRDHPPAAGLRSNMCVFQSGIGSKMPRTFVPSKATLTRILLGRVRDAGFGAKSWQESHAYYHACLLQRRFRTYGYRSKTRRTIWSRTITQVVRLQIVVRPPASR